MISWTLDNTTFHYWTINDSGEMIWGTPKDGDEVIIDDRFKYIFKVTKSEADKISDNILKTMEKMESGTETRFSTDANPYIMYVGTDFQQAWEQALSEYPSSRGMLELSATLSQNPGEDITIEDIRTNFIENNQEDNSNEIAVYMREAQQMMNNGR